MRTLLTISQVTIHPDMKGDDLFDFPGRCAFALCTKGELEIKFLNEYFKVTERSMFACMPFVKIGIIKVNRPSEIIFGSIMIKDVPRMINRWVDTSNLSAIQNHPSITIQYSQFTTLLASIDEYKSDYEAYMRGKYTNICHHIHEDIIELQARLIVAKVLKIYFTNISMEPKAYMPRDLEYQQFMLSLYTNFKEHRDVKFYANRSGVSEKYFSTLIRQLSGSSPSEWIETVVVGEAKTLLSDAQYSIKEIASGLNFPDAPTFTKYFQRITGITPKAYRKSILDSNH